MMVPALLPAAVLLLFLPGTPAPFSNMTQFNITVMNSVTYAPNKTYPTYTRYRAVLLSGMKRLRDSNSGFVFTYTNNFDYGAYLESVNDLFGCNAQHTFWGLKVIRNGSVMIPDVGISCFIPCAYDEVILEYSQYEPENPH